MYRTDGAMTKKNVILVTIDCLRADHLSCYGYGRKTSPFIDLLSAKGIRFGNAFANGPFTSASFLSILASAYPLEFKNQLPLSQDAVLISEVLQKEGIRTAAIHSNPYLSAFYGYNRGWSYFQDFLSSNPNKNVKKRSDMRRLIRKYLPKPILKLDYLFKAFLGLTKRFENAETITKRGLSWLNKNKDFPFFLWLHYMDLHEPYSVFNTKIKRKYSKNISRLSQVKLVKDMEQKKIEPKNIKGIMEIYDDMLGYVDENLNELFDFLSREGLVDCTLMVLTSDHGQEFWDHGHFGHNARFYDELLHIPLILFGPGIGTQVNRSLVSQLDIAPTILNFYGICVPEGYRGNNLFSTSTQRFTISEASHNEEGVYITAHKIYPSKFRTYAVRTEKWKYIRKEKRCEMYDLEKDPREMENVVDEEEEVKAEEFESIIREHILWEEKLQKQRAMIHEKKKITEKIKTLKSIGKI